ncbi:MAG: energy-coupling factor transporter transmembrane component T [Candidatus Marsarchaeota archaeon]
MSWASGLTFVHGDSFLHRLNPLPKIVIVIGFFLAAIYVYDDLFHLIVLFGLSAALIVAARQTRRWWPTMKMSLFVAAVIAALDYAFVGGLWFSVAMGVRFLVVVSAFSIYSLTTPPDDTAAVFMRIGLPYSFVVAFMMSIRFLPLLAKEAQNIVDAQTSRGFNMSTRNPIKLIKNYIPILVPLMVISLMRADSAAQALETRGFGYTNKPSSYGSIGFSAWDWLVTVGSVALIVYATLQRVGLLI